MKQHSVFVVGDSISIHYGPYLKEYLTGFNISYSRKEGEEEALLNLDQPMGANGGDSSMVLEYLTQKLILQPDFFFAQQQQQQQQQPKEEEKEEDRQIHNNIDSSTTSTTTTNNSNNKNILLLLFNCGLHDIKVDPTTAATNTTTRKTKKTNNDTTDTTNDQGDENGTTNNNNNNKNDSTYSNNDTRKTQIPIEKYKQNLQSIIDLIRKYQQLSPNNEISSSLLPTDTTTTATTTTTLAKKTSSTTTTTTTSTTFIQKIVWIRTTPLDETNHNIKQKKFYRFEDHLQLYNQAADEIMKTNGIPCIDLYTFTNSLKFHCRCDRSELLFCDHVHFHEHVREKQAAFISGWISNYLSSL